MPNNKEERNHTTEHIFVEKDTPKIDFFKRAKIATIFIKLGDIDKLLNLYFNLTDEVPYVLLKIEIAEYLLTKGVLSRKGHDLMTEWLVEIVCDNDCVPEGLLSTDVRDEDGSGKLVTFGKETYYSDGEDSDEDCYDEDGKFFEAVSVQLVTFGKETYYSDGEDSDEDCYDEDSGDYLVIQ